MAKLDQLTRPIMGRAAGLKSNKAFGQLGEEGQHVFAPQRVRRLVPLAFLSPKIIQAIADGTVPAGLTVSNLTQALPHAWTAQEQMLGLS
jgi:hypothetical protein